MNYPDAKAPDSLAQGQEFERFARDMLLHRLGWVVDLYESRHFQWHEGESRQGFEFKEDRRCTDTGRLSIEVAEKTRASNSEWVPSGIWRRDNTILYVQGNERIVFVFSKKVLQRWHDYQLRLDRLEMHEERGTVRGFYLSLAKAEDLAEKTLRRIEAAKGEEG